MVGGGACLIKKVDDLHFILCGSADAFGYQKKWFKLVFAASNESIDDYRKMALKCGLYTDTE